MSRPIYDQPDHPHYGPVRRLHIMCLQLFGAAFPKVEEVFARLNNGEDWTVRMVTRLELNAIPESVVQRDMLRWFLSIHR